MAEAQVQTQTQVPLGSTAPVVKEHSFRGLTLTVTLLIILAILCVVYLALRRKNTTKHVDEKAGDEGEDS